MAAKIPGCRNAQGGPLWEVKGRDEQARREKKKQKNSREKKQYKHKKISGKLGVVVEEKNNAFKGEG